MCFKYVKSARQCYKLKNYSQSETRSVGTGEVIYVSENHAAEIHQAIRYGLSRKDISVLLVSIDMSDQSRSSYLVTVGSSQYEGSN